VFILGALFSVVLIGIGLIVAQIRSLRGKTASAKTVIFIFKIILGVQGVGLFLKMSEWQNMGLNNTAVTLADVILVLTFVINLFTHNVLRRWADELEASEQTNPLYEFPYLDGAL
jgi:hypothetical protein